MMGRLLLLAISNMHHAGKTARRRRRGSSSLGCPPLLLLLPTRVVSSLAPARLLWHRGSCSAWALLFCPPRAPSPPPAACFVLPVEEAQHCAARRCAAIRELPAAAA